MQILPQVVAVFWPMSEAELQYPTRYYMVVRKQIGLSKALQEPTPREGAERAMASLFWTSTRNRVPALVKVLPAFRPVHPGKRV